MLSGEDVSGIANASASSEVIKTLWLRDLLSSHSTHALSSTIPEKHLPLLGGGIQKARIRTFGWDSTRAAGGEKSLGRDCIRPVALELLRCLSIHEGNHGPKSAEEEAKVPLVFVGMDIGGTIVKQVRMELCSAFGYGI